MKINYRRIIKVLSSCFAIAMVLIATVAMPVFAVTPGNYDLKDYLESVTHEEGRVVSLYDFSSITPLMRVEKNGVEIDSGSYGGYTLFPDDEGGQVQYSFNVFPLGKDITTSVKDKSSMIYAGDLKSYASVDFAFTFVLSTDVEHAIDKFRIASVYNLRFYDSSFKEVGRLTSPIENYSATALDKYTYMWRPAVTLTLPEETVYISFSVRSSIYTNGYFEGGIIQFSCNGFKSKVIVDDIFYESALYQRIVDKLEDTYDSLQSIDQTLLENQGRLDEIINGNDQMAADAQTSDEDLRDAQDALQDAVNNFDEATDLDHLLPENATDAAGIADIIKRWKLTDGWEALLQIIRPILSHGYFPDILLMVVACINISVLLIGR